MSLNSGLTKCLSVDGQHAAYNPISDLNGFYNGIGLFTAPTLNMPGDGWYLVISSGVPGTVCQRAVNLFGGSTYHRHCAANSWSSWKTLAYSPSNHNHDNAYIARDASVSRLFLIEKIKNWGMLMTTIDGTDYSIPFSGEAGTGYISHIGMVWRKNKRQLRVCWRQDGAEYISYFNVDEDT